MLTLFPVVRVELMMCKCQPLFLMYYFTYITVLVRFRLPVLCIAFGKMKCYI